MTPVEDRLLEIADDHDRRASRLSNRENVASERQASLAIRSALLSIGVLRAERDTLRSQLDAARGALELALSIAVSLTDDHLSTSIFSTDFVERAHKLIFILRTALAASQPGIAAEGAGQTGGEHG